MVCHNRYGAYYINEPNATLNGSAGVPISGEKFWAYSSSNSSEGIKEAMITLAKLRVKLHKSL
ncbi:hypothetical protein [Coleofasciculus sp.]|uniref:hypothetical protein n=1 Tax=Coleofasciculus sp. TaxID=3100458 RepID=UPI0039F984BC